MIIIIKLYFLEKNFFNILYKIGNSYKFFQCSKINLIDFIKQYCNLE